MKIEEIYSKTTTTQVEEEDRKHWKTNHDNDLSSKNILNQPRTILETIRCISSNYVGRDGQEFIIGFLLMLGLWTCIKWIVSFGDITDTSFLDTILKEEFIHISGIAIGAICVLGPWISTLLLYNIIFSLMWPLLLITGVILAIPTWREYISDEYLPDNFYFADSVTTKLSNSTMAFTAPC